MGINIVLSNRDEWAINYVLTYTNWTIALLILGNPISKTQYMGNPRIENIISQRELFELNDFTGIEYDTLKKIKHVQMIGDYGSRRIIDDFQYSRYTFYNNISYFERIISEKKISLCIIGESFHGFSGDYLLAEIAKMHDIPCFVTSFQSFSLRSIYDYTSGELLPVLRLNDAYCIGEKDIIEDTYYYGKNVIQQSMSMRKKISSVLFSIFGGRIFFFFRYIYERLHGRDYYSNYHKVSFTNYIRCLYSNWKNLSYVERFYTRPNYKRKYIIFFLHFEPEAVFPDFADVLDCQLVMIGMLVQVLPKGWNLYVKVHPSIYKINTERDYMQFILNWSTFFTKFFVDKIASFPNTKIISIDYPAGELIQNSEAIASICGTVTKEGIMKNKPIIIFGNRKRYILGKISGIYCVETITELEDAIKEIDRNNHREYRDYIYVFQKYLFPDREEGYIQAIETIKNYLDVKTGVRYGD